MVKVARHLLRTCPIDAFAAGKMITPAILIGVLLSAWPIFAQTDSGDPSVPPWQSAPSQDVLSCSSGEDGCVGEDCLAECNPNQCEPCTPCYSLHNRLWIRSEYLLWWTQGSTLPPLVTTSTAGTAPGVAGVLGQPGTSILFGNRLVKTNANSGWRVALGYWFDDCQCTGIEVGYFGFGRNTTRFSASNFGTPIIARPFYDTQYGAQSAMLAAHPEFLKGSVSCELSSQLQAVEVLLRRNVFQRDCNRLDFLIGWRFARLDESLRIDQSSEWTQSQGPIVVGTTKSLYDLFDTQNQFNGAQLGFAYREQVGRWSLEALMKLGVGYTHSRVQIGGMTTTTVPGGGTTTFVGDLLAQETNIGQYTQNQFAIVPELGVTLGYDLTCQLRATFGYTFFYWSQVARPAGQLDTNVSQLPPETLTGSHQPAFTFNMSDYWAQGMNFGLEYRF